MNEVEHISTNCLNCDQSLTEGSKYCHGCGQKVTDGRITLKELFREFIESVFNIDTKFFRTLGNLFIPGKLTEEYFSGKHKSFLQPIRLFLVMTILLIASISYVLRDQQVNPSSIQYKWEEQQHLHEMLLAADTIREQATEKFDLPIAKQAIDTFYQDILIYDKSYKDTIQVPFSFAGSPMHFAREDFNQFSDNELIEKYLPDQNFFVKLMRKQEIRFLKSNENLIAFLLNKVTWLVFIIIPMFALFLKLLYIRRNFYYVEHLIFSFHIHTLLFLWAIIVLLLDDFLHEALEGVSTLLLAVYIVMAMRRFYQQKWWKTILKFFIAQFGYWIIVGLGVIITGFLSLLLF